MITSADWEPKAGEPWVIIAYREGDILRTNVCEQMPGTQATVREVESSLSVGIQPPTEETPGPGDAAGMSGGGLPVAPIIIGAIGTVVVAGAVALLVGRRRRQSP